MERYLVFGLVWVFLLCGCVSNEDATPSMGDVTESVSTSKSDVRFCDNFRDVPQYRSRTLSKNYWRDRCRLFLTKDVGICDSLEVRAGKDEPPRFDKFECYFNLALLTADDSYCDKITIRPDLRHTCKAKVNEDLSECKRVDPIVNCYRDYFGYVHARFEDDKMYIALNSSDCFGFPDNLQESCLYDFATKTDNLSLCEKIEEDNRLKTGCKVAIYNSISDESSCNELIKLGSMGVAHNCYYNLAKNKSDTHFCDYLDPCGEQSTACKELCIAVASNNDELCYSLPNTDLKGTCFYELADRKSDTSLCFEISDETSIYNCFANAAKQPSDCDKIDKNKEPDTYSWCIYNLAKEGQDDGLCKMINEPRYANMCYERILGIEKIEWYRYSM